MSRYWKNERVALNMRAMRYIAAIIAALSLNACGGDSAPVASAPLNPISVQVPNSPPTPTQPTPPVVTEPAPPPPMVDDTAALQALVSAGGLIQLEGRTYHINQSLIPTVHGTTIRGQSGTVIEFKSPAVGTPRNPGVTDRVIGTNSMTHTSQLPIAQSIAVGDTSFTAVNESDVANLMPGDWVVITVNDPGVADANTHLGYPTYVDWAQVSYVDGTVVHVSAPFRMAFSNSLPFYTNDSGLGFVRVELMQNLTIENLTITVDAGSPVVGVYVLGSLGTTLRNVTINDDGSDMIYSEEAKGLSIIDCTLNGGSVLNEFSETVDLTITGTKFAMDTVAIALDLGTGFFEVSGNTIAKSGHVALYAFYNVHDGAVSDNIIEPITDLKNIGTIGIWLHGSPNISMTGNTLTGPGTTAIEAESDPSAALSEPSTGDVASGNNISGYTNTVSIH
jgi:hypothetical protein